MISGYGFGDGANVNLYDVNLASDQTEDCHTKLIHFFPFFASIESTSVIVYCLLILFFFCLFLHVNEGKIIKLHRTYTIRKKKESLNTQRVSEPPDKAPTVAHGNLLFPFSRYKRLCSVDTKKRCLTCKRFQTHFREEQAALSSLWTAAEKYSEDKYTQVFLYKKIIPKAILHGLKLNLRCLGPPIVNHHFFAFTQFVMHMHLTAINNDCLVQFDLLPSPPSPRATPGTSPAFRAWGLAIV